MKTISAENIFYVPGFGFKNQYFVRNEKKMLCFLYNLVSARPSLKVKRINLHVLYVTYSYIFALLVNISGLMFHSTKLNQQSSC